MRRGAKRHDGWLAIIIVVGILIVDQIVKIMVKTNMSLRESISLQIGFKLTLSKIMVWHTE